MFKKNNKKNTQKNNNSRYNKYMKDSYEHHNCQNSGTFV